MSIRFPCPQCGKALRVQDDLAGRDARCPKCNAKLRVPRAEPNSGKHVELALPLADFDQALRRDTESGSNAIPKHSRGHTGTWLAGIAVFLGCCLVVACGVIAFLLYGQHHPTKTLAVANSEAAITSDAVTHDPRSDFEAFLPKELLELKKAVPDLLIDNPKYDVRKTDSLVSPFMATCTFEVIWHNRSNAKDRPADFKGTLQLVHAYQDSRWAFKGGTCHLPVQSAIDPAYDCEIERFSDLARDTLLLRQTKDDLARRDKALSRVQREIELERAAGR
jgi:hypothetical protein